MREILLGLMVLCGLAGSAAAETLIDTRFGRDTQPIQVFDPRAEEPRVSGALPQGWKDNSGWARVWAKYTPQEEKGDAYLRVSVLKVESGRTCLCFNPLPDQQEDAYYRLAVKVRSPSRMSLTLSLRVAPPPYTPLWSETCYPAADRWDERSFTFRAVKNRQPIGFWIYLDGIGRTDIHSLRLERISREDADAALRARYPARAAGNLIRNTRLPLGLQSGWNLSPYGGSSDGDDVAIAPDAGVLGPSGAPALRVRVVRRIAIYSEPFAPVLGPARYTGSLYVRGAGKGELHVLAYTQPDQDYYVVGAAKFAVQETSGWQRVESAFTPRPFVPTGGLRLCLDPGTYWIDAFQVEVGGKAAPYAPQAVCEVALALPEAPEAMARVQFDDEPARVRFATTGAPEHSTLRACLFDAYGKRESLRSVALSGRFLQDGTLAYANAFGQHPRGALRIEAWVENAAGKQISPFHELVFHRLRRPRYWGEDAPDSPFGVHTFPITRHHRMAKALGANWVRLHGPGSTACDWGSLEPKKGEWHFDDETIRRYRRDHLKILGNIQTAPQWASLYEEMSKETRPKKYGWSESFLPPRDLDAFANYVRTLVARYKGVIDTYEFWNEPYWCTVWDRAAYPGREGEGAAPPALVNYTRLMRVAYESARAADPSVRFLGFCSNITPDREGAAFSGREWIAGVAAANGVNWCDGISFHHYEPTAPFGFAGDNIDLGFHVITGPLVKKHGRIPRPLWMTEGSPLLFTPLANAGFYHHTLCGDEWAVETAAPGDRMARYLISLLAHGVKKVFLYSMHCHSSLLYRKLDYNDLVTGEGYPNLAAAAYSALTWHLEDTHYVKTLSPAEGVSAHLFEGKGRCVATVLPHPAGHARFVLPRRAKAEDLFGNPLAPGSALGETVAYVTSPTITVLEKALAGPGAGR